MTVQDITQGASVLDLNFKLHFLYFGYELLQVIWSC